MRWHQMHYQPVEMLFSIHHWWEQYTLIGEATWLSLHACEVPEKRYNTSKMVIKTAKKTLFSFLTLIPWISCWYAMDRSGSGKVSCFAVPITGPLFIWKKHLSKMNRSIWNTRKLFSYCKRNNRKKKKHSIKSQDAIHGKKVYIRSYNIYPRIVLSPKTRF